MKICTECLSELRCIKTGVVLYYGNGHCYSGDKFQCPQCQFSIIDANGSSFYHKDISDFKDIINMSPENQIGKGEL